jgi:LPXTG-motif cell wall-anchored protein
MKKWIVCLVAGLALLIVGFSLTADHVVRCADFPMSPGQVCQEASGSGDVVTRKTYDEVAKETEAAQHVGEIWGRVAFVAGGVLTLLAVGGLVVRRRRRNNQDPTPSDLFFRRRAAAQAAPPPPRPPEDGPGPDQPSAR